LRYRELFADVAAWQANPTGYAAGQMRNLSLSLVDLESLAPVLRGEVPVMVAANRQADILAALRLADEYGLDLIIVGGAEAWALADTLAAAQVPVVLDSLDNEPASFEQLGSRAETAGLLDAAGVRVVLSTFDAHRAGILRQVAGNAVRGGLDHESALAAVTRRPAEALGLLADYGTLEPGKVANLVVWSGDPFELSTRARHVVVQGQPMPLENRQSRLFERYRHLPEAPPLESVP
jgi:imidazolonepropionase-like amidohydrolase